jgi:hypothetical protein
VAPHFVPGIGPTLSKDLVGNDSFRAVSSVANPATTIGASFVVRGWRGWRGRL